jgi:voltage-gated potassium channel
MDRAGVARASCIIIDNPRDDVTMTAALYCNSRNPKAHIIAYFQDEQLGRLLKSHCPNVEYTPSVSVEMLAKAAVDPGSSLLHQQLLDVSEGMTQYSVRYPEGAPASRVERLFGALKQRYEATLIGVATRPGDAIALNPGLAHPVVPGSVLYYIADERINGIDWEQLHAG